MTETTPTGTTPEDRLVELGLELPPVADYVTHTQIGPIIYTSGMLPWVAGDLKFAGKMGGELTTDQGYHAFQLSALNGISLLKSIVGDLSNIKRIHRLEGVANATRLHRHTVCVERCVAFGEPDFREERRTFADDLFQSLDAA